LEIWINNIPAVLLLPSEKETTVSVPLNENVIPGTNKIGVMLHAAPLASKSQDPWPDDPTAGQYSGPTSLELQIAQYADDQPVHKDGPPPSQRSSGKDRRSRFLACRSETFPASMSWDAGLGKTPKFFQQLTTICG